MARKVENSLTIVQSNKKSRGTLTSKEEKLRQEGRKEVLEWLRKYEVVSYSKPEDVYFIYDRKTEMLLVLPWRQGSPWNVG